MTLVQRSEGVESPNRAVCLEHPDQAAMATCEHCGRYVCDDCRGWAKQCSTCRRASLQEVPSSAERAQVTLVSLWAGMAATALLATLLLINMVAPESASTLFYPAILLGLGARVLQLVTGIAFLMWVYRAVKQTGAMGLNVGETPGWAVGWWFVPVANFIRPYLFMRRMVALLGGEPLVGRLSLPWWWGLWLGYSITDRLQSRATWFLPDDTSDSTYYAIGILCCLLNLGAAVLCARLVREVQKSLDMRRDGRA